MRSVTLLVTPPPDQPTAHLFGEESGLSRDRIYNLNVLEDGTMVLLGRVRGDLERARQLLAEQDEILGFSVSGEDEDGGLVYVHTRPPPPIDRFLALPREHEVFFEFPVEGTRDGRLRLVMVGESNEVLQRALSDVPDAVSVTVERIGPYVEGGGDLRAMLTDRQREVLDAALELGYYEVPRRTTHRDIADRLGLATPTVSEHLQKIEARVFGTFDVGSSGPP